MTTPSAEQTHDHRRDERWPSPAYSVFLRTIARGENPFTAFLVIALGLWLSLR